jgi:hypothetical protein
VTLFGLPFGLKLPRSLLLSQRTYVQQMGFQHSAWTNEQWITKLATLPKTKKRAKNEWHFQSQT